MDDYERGKLLFQIFLHVNRELNDFQREVLEMVIGEDANADTMAKAVDKLNKTANLLERANWKPKKGDGDMVLRPNHYDRFPMEPTYFIAEAGGFHWCIENFIKYVVRYRFKNGVEDLRKAMRNLAMYIRWLDGDPAWSR